MPVRLSLLRLRKHQLRSLRPYFYVCTPVLLLLISLSSLACLNCSPSNATPYKSSSNYQLTALQRDVVAVTKATYADYSTHCWGRDEYAPASDKCHDWFRIGLMILDSLDTLILMDLKDEYNQSKEWALKHLTFTNTTAKVSLFEIVIRAIGGLNSAYELTQDPLWLKKSIMLGDMLLESFGSASNACPPPTVFIGDSVTARTNGSSIARSCTPAELGTMQLEFRTLSDQSGDPKYRKAVDACQDELMKAIPDSGLVQAQYNIRDGNYFGHRICIGGGVDSFYEMMIKNWLVWNKRDTRLKDSYVKAVEGVYQLLVREEHGNVYVGEVKGHDKRFQRTMDHLACFFPGTLAIAALNGLGGGLGGTGKDDYMPRARELTKSCFAMTRGTQHGLPGEITDFSVEPPRPSDGQDISFLRPEVVEALYYMDKLDPQAGDTYKAMGRLMWRDMRAVAQVKGKESGVMSTTYNLLNDEVSHEDKLHSFVVAETFKYFFLLFDERPPREGPMNPYDWVYTTEAHPVRIRRG